METMYFVYIDANGEIDSFELSHPKKSDGYIQGYSPTVGGFRTFRKDRFIMSFDSMDEADKYLNEVIPTLDIPKPIKVSRGKSKRYDSPNIYREPSKDGPLEICFTGFKKADKDRLTQVAHAASMLVRSDVTVNLHILCCGYNAGPKKAEAATKKGIMILDETQFLNLIDTGEIPIEYFV